MILTIFLIILGLSITFLIVGYWTEDQIIMTLGWLLMWFPSFALSGLPFPTADPGIQYPAGTNTTTTYAYNTSMNLIRTEETMTDTYAEYHHRLLGILLLFVSVMGLVLTLLDMRNTEEGDGPPRLNWSNV